MSLVGLYSGVAVASLEDRRTSKLLRRYEKGPTRFGVQIGCVTALPWAATIFTLGADSADSTTELVLGCTAVSIFLGAMMAGFTGGVALMGAVVWNWAHLRIALRSGRVVRIHPLVLQVWREEVKRTGIKLSTDEFATETGARFHLIKHTLNDLAADATHPDAEEKIKASLLTRLRGILREEASTLPKVYAQRDQDAAYEREVFNEGVRARYQLPPDGESTRSIGN